MSIHRPRRPAGAPGSAGGQFAATNRPAPGISLDAPSEEHLAAVFDEAEGTFNTNDLQATAAMLGHEQPTEVRAAAARTVYPGVAEAASHDPDPLVRAIAMDGWDLPADSAHRLRSDPQVQAVMAFVTR